MKRIVLSSILALVALLSLSVGVLAAYEPDNESLWIDRGIVEVSNFYPGASVSQAIMVHNPLDEYAPIGVYFKIPTRVTEGYESATWIQSSWVTFEGDLVFKPYETKEVIVTLTMPEDAKIADKWEFWVVFHSDGGFINLETVSKWKIDMVDSSIWTWLLPIGGGVIVVAILVLILSRKKSE